MTASLLAACNPSIKHSSKNIAGGAAVTAESAVTNVGGQFSKCFASCELKPRKRNFWHRFRD